MTALWGMLLDFGLTCMLVSRFVSCCCNRLSLDWASLSRFLCCCNSSAASFLQALRYTRMHTGLTVHSKSALPLAACDSTCWTAALSGALLLHLCCHRAQPWPAVLGAIRHLLHVLQAVTEQLGLEVARCMNAHEEVKCLPAIPRQGWGLGTEVLAERIVYLLLLILLQAQSVGQVPGTVHCTPILLLLLKLGSQGCFESPEL